MDQAQNLREKVNSLRPLKIVTIASGKGGVGKSTLTVNLAIELANMGRRVLILDSDFGLANVDVMFGTMSKYNLSHFLRGERTLSEILQAGYENVHFISGGSGIEELLHIGENDVERLMDGLAELETRKDMILCDVGAGINSNIVSMILASTETIIVITPEPTSIVDAYALIKTVVYEDPKHKIYAVVNKSDNRAEAENVFRGFAEVVYKNLGKRILSLGAAMYDDNVSRSIKKQTPLIVSEPDGKMAKSVREIAAKLTGQPCEKHSEGLLGSLFAKIFKR